MAETIQDKKLTQEEADNLMRAIELDFVALYKIMEQDIIELTQDYEGTPEELINDISNMIVEGLNDQDIIVTDNKNKLYEVAKKYITNLNKRL